MRPSRHRLSPVSVRWRAIRTRSTSTLAQSRLAMPLALRVRGGWSRWCTRFAVAEADMAWRRCALALARVSQSLSSASNEISVNSQFPTTNSPIKIGTTNQALEVGSRRLGIDALRQLVEEAVWRLRPDS